MEGDKTCPRCGQLIQRGERECPRCTAERDLPPYQPRTVLAFSLLGVAILSVVTAFAAKLYHAKERSLAQQWYATGEQELRANRAENAVTDFRTALNYSRDNEVFQLRLAQALLAAHHADEARAYLLNLWEHHPESAELNLELGRLAAKDRDVQQALRYFHSALYGDWQDQDAVKRRREVRLELYRYLMSLGAESQAQAELSAGDKHAASDQ